MPAQRYSQYFNIDEKYYAVVTKELIDEGKVKWEGFYPHETFIQLLRQVVDMLSGKETKSIWVEGIWFISKTQKSDTIIKAENRIRYWGKRKRSVFYLLWH